MKINKFIFPVKIYCLTESIQLLNQSLIQNGIKQGSVTVLPVVDSTNQYLLDNLDILCSGDVCVAEYQIAGRGRRGHKWFSPFCSNLYLSMYWYFKKKPSDIIGLSQMISIVIAEILYDNGVDQVRTKWPNDIYLFNRKLAGILVEMIVKSKKSIQIVIGTGINLTTHSIKKKTNNNWINLQEINIKIDRNIFAINLIKRLQSSLRIFEINGLKPFLSRWKKFDNFINRPVKLIIKDKEIYGISRGINEQGALMLEQNGIINFWMGEEISLRSAE